MRKFLRLLLVSAELLSTCLARGSTVLLLVVLIPCATWVNAQTVDMISFGDPASENSHSMSVSQSQVITGGLNQPARRLLPKTSLDVYGGEMVFTMAVDPLKQTFFTVKMWGSDTGGGSWLILDCNGREIGGRHGAVGLGEDPLYFAGNGWYANRFFYRTVPLPLAMTRGQTSVTIRIRSSGTIFYYAPIFTYVPQYQHYMAAPTPGIYKAYTHCGSIVDVSGEAQGTAPSVPTPRALESESTAIANTKTNVNSAFSSKLAAAGSSLSQTDASFLAQCYDAKTNAAATWITYPSGKTSANVGSQVVAALDALVTGYAADATVASNGWGGALGDMGDAVRLSWPLISSSLGTTVAYGGTLGTVTRQAGWSAALRASVDSGRYNRRTIANQEISCAWMIYRANRSLLLVDSANALKEAEAVRYFKEACGLQPYLGNDQTGGGSVPIRGTQPYGPNWYLCTTDGTTKDGDGFVGSDYGEVGSWVYKMGLLAGDSQIVSRALVMTRARCQFRYPSTDDGGYLVMQGTDPIGVRNNDLPSHYTYLGRGYGDDLFMASQGAAAIGSDLLGYQQQAMIEGQLVRSTFSTDPYVPGRWGAFRAQAQTGRKLPASAGQPDYAWVDEENMAVAAKAGEDRFYANLYWRQPGYINGLAKVFHLTPTLARLADVTVDDVRFRTSGLSSIIGTAVDTFATPVDDPVSAFAGWPVLSALRSDISDPSVFNGKTNRDAGRGTGYTLRYGNWLVGINAHYTDSYAMQLPSDFVSARDLVSGSTMSGPVVLGPKQSAVFYLGNATPPSAPPGRTLYVAAVGGNASVQVGWNHAGGAASYNILRSTLSGSGYQTIATGVTANSYMDATAKNGTTYFYAVQSVGTTGTSGNSPEASATSAAPQSPALPAPWADLDLGTSTGGSAALSGGTFTVKSGPGDIYGTADGCHLVYQPLIGDGTIIARVQSQSSGNPYAKAALVFRSSLAANAMRIAISLEPVGRVEFSWRGSDGGSTSVSTYGSGLAAPQWLRLSRNGSTLTAWVSPDGINWTPAGSYTTTNLSYAAYVGLAVSPANGAAGQTNTAVFTNVAFPLGASAPPAVPGGLTALGGNSSVSLGWNAAGGAAGYKVKRGPGAGGPFVTVANVAVGTTFIDYGRPAGAPVFYVVSAVNSVGESADSSPASATPSVAPAAVADLAATAADGRVTLNWAAMPGATDYTVRRGTQYAFVTTVLASGSTGTTFTDTSVTNGTTYLYSVTASVGGSEGIDIVVDATPPGLPLPWVTRDIGDVDLPGAGTSTDGAAFTLKASGRDIWNAADEFRYVYRAVSGDCDLSANVVDIANAAGGTLAKVGVMLRNTAAPESIHAAMILTQSGSLVFEKRGATGGSTSIVASSGGVGTSYWLRIKRVGNSITAYSSPNGSAGSWVQSGTAQTLALNASCLVGLAVSSVSDSTVCTAHFNNLALNGNVLTTPAGLTAVGGDRSVSLNWNAVSTAKGYNVRRATTGGGPYVPAGSVTAPGFIDTALTNGVTYYYVVSAKDSVSETPDSVPVSTTPHVTFAAWQSRYFTSAQLLDAGISGADGDANGDGIKNIAAYAFNASPWNDLHAALPTVELADGRLTMSYLRRRAPAEVSCAVEVSERLVEWNSGANYTSEIQVVPVDSDMEKVTVRDNAPAPAGQQRFMRVKITY